MQTNLSFGMYNGLTRYKSRKSYAHSAFENLEWGCTLRSPARKITHTYKHIHEHMRARVTRVPTHAAGYTLCLHSPITDSRSYAIMIDLPAWLMTGELPSAKSDGHDFRTERNTIREAVGSIV